MPTIVDQRAARGVRLGDETLKGEVRDSVDHDQPHQHARGRRADARRRRRRHGVDGAAAARRSGLVKKAQRRAARTRSTPASPAIRRAWITCSRTQRASCLRQSACVPRDRDRIEPAATKKRIAVVGAGPAGLACATTLAERGHRRHAVREARAKSAASSTWPSAFPARRSSTRRCVTTRSASSDTGVELRLNTRARMRRSLTRLRRRRARDRRDAARTVDRRHRSPEGR